MSVSKTAHNICGRHGPAEPAMPRPMYDTGEGVGDMHVARNYINHHARNKRAPVARESAPRRRPKRGCNHSKRRFHGWRAAPICYNRHREAPQV